MPPTPDWPDEDDGRRRLAALHGPDPTAENDFVRAYFDPLLRFLRGVFPHADEGHAVTAAGEALLGLTEHPARFDPEKGTLRLYLCMAARGDLLNLLTREGKRRAREIPLEAVEDVPARGNTGARADDGPTWADPRLADELAALDPGQRATLELMRSGERSTAAFAKALALDPADPETARAVKRKKDTIMARLRRAGGRS